MLRNPVADPSEYIELIGSGDEAPDRSCPYSTNAQSPRTRCEEWERPYGGVVAARGWQTHDRVKRQHRTAGFLAQSPVDEKAQRENTHHGARKPPNRQARRPGGSHLTRCEAISRAVASSETSLDDTFSRRSNAGCAASASDLISHRTADLSNFLGRTPESIVGVLRIEPADGPATAAGS
jgi:hypothetical protein